MPFPARIRNGSGTGAGWDLRPWLEAGGRCTVDSDVEEERAMAADPISELVRHVDEAARALWRMTATVSGGVRHAAEDAVDLGTMWITPVRRLSAEQRRFAEQMAVWAERHRQLAEEMAAWAETQRAFAERLDALADPILHYSEQVSSAVRGVVSLLPEGNGAAAPRRGGAAMSSTGPPTATTESSSRPIPETG